MVSVATWNLAWRSPRSRLGRAISGVLADPATDVWVLTEALIGSQPYDGHVCDAGSDWGYRVTDMRRRKVLMWSREPWRDVEVLEPDAPTGRLVAATTDTAIGSIRLVGVCIPWRSAHVSSGRRDRRQWEDHLAFLDALGPFLARQPRPLVVAGDFNQRLPRDGQTEAAYDALVAALADLDVVTAHREARLLDHIAVSGDLMVDDCQVWSGHSPDGQELTDHWGARVVLVSGSGADAHSG